MLDSIRTQTWLRCTMCGSLWNSTDAKPCRCSQDYLLAGAACLLFVAACLVAVVIVALIKVWK